MRTLTARPPPVAPGCRFQIQWATFIGLGILLISTPATGIFVKKITMFRRAQRSAAQLGPLGPACQNLALRQAGQGRVMHAPNRAGQGRVARTHWRPGRRGR